MICKIADSIEPHAVRLLDLRNVLHDRQGHSGHTRTTQHSKLSRFEHFPALAGGSAVFRMHVEISDKLHDNSLNTCHSVKVSTHQSKKYFELKISISYYDTLTR
jgi:hypothetical protein